ncbi:MAG: nuclear transport factor 2 family protein [Gammaproteobacteria bacterium]|nr:nuclear transport factor 2 family protein [Gammaproteobacteria bacterium]
MIGNKLELRTPDEAEAVYYEAFMHCDKEVMAALWADGDVICIHPGSGAIVGHEAVVRSWSHIFTNARMPEINFTVAKRTMTDDLAVHIVAEEIATGNEASAVVLATNVYQKFPSGWLMTEHHSSLVPVQTERQGQTLQ